MVYKVSECGTSDNYIIIIGFMILININAPMKSQCEAYAYAYVDCFEIFSSSPMGKLFNCLKLTPESRTISSLDFHER